MYFKNIEDDIHLLIVKVFGLDIGFGLLDSHYVSTYKVWLKYEQYKLR